VKPALAIRGVRLKRSGGLYREAVAAGLARIGAAGAMLIGANEEAVVIAASQSVSMLFLMPLRKDLYRALGRASTHIHLLTCDYDLLGPIGKYEADIVLSYHPGGAVLPDGEASTRTRLRPAHRTRTLPARLCLDFLGDLTRRADDMCHSGAVAS